MGSALCWEMLGRFLGGEIGIQAKKLQAFSMVVEIDVKNKNPWISIAICLKLSRLHL